MHCKGILAFLVLSVSVLSGCPQDQVNFSDDLDMVFDFKPFNPLHPPPDDLHIPYVVGAEFRMYAFRDHDRMSLEDSWAESMDHTILDIRDRQSDKEWSDFACAALRPGVTEVVLYRSASSEKEWGRAFVEVAQPDRVDLTFAGPFFIHTDPDDYRVLGTVNVLAGGTATFLVEYFQGTRRLYGNGVLEARVRGPGMEAWSAQTYFFEDREWLQVAALEPGNHVVDLSVDGVAVGTLSVRALTDNDVAFIELRAESDRHAEDGETLAVLALGYSGGGEPIYGIEFDWSIDGQQESGQGDLYKYPFHRRMNSDLEASYGPHSQSVYISGGDDGWVSSTNRLGCAGSSRSSGPGAPILFLAVLAGTLVLRRRPG